jgi:uncharacterized protein (TIGR03435 family)
MSEILLEYIRCVGNNFGSRASYVGYSLNKRMNRMTMNGLPIGRFRAAILSLLFLIGMAMGQTSMAQTPAAGDPKDLSGQWQGTAQGPAPAPALRVVFLISRVDGGGWKTVFNYIDLIAQGQGIPRSANLTLQGSSVEIKVPGNSGSYKGQLSADGKAISGTWSQGGPEMTLNLIRTTTETAWEVPKPPPPLKPMAADADPSFEVATIKPNPSGGAGNGFGIRQRTFNAFNASLADLIVYAYDVHKKQVIGGPDWMDKEKFDITAKADGEGAPSNLQWRIMVQKLLTERFQLTFHKEKRELSVYVLSVAKGGPKNLTKSDSTTDGFSVPIRDIAGGYTMPMRNVLMTDFTGFALQGAVLDRPVLDQTGIKGRYDFTLTWAALGTEFGGAARPPAAGDNPPPSLFTAIQEQLGLKLEPVKAPADVMVIDKAEKPSAN